MKRGLSMQIRRNVLEIIIEFIIMYHKHLLIILFIGITIAFSYRGAYFFETIYILDRIIFKDILNILALCCLSTIAVHPIVLFQMLNSEILNDIDSIDMLFTSFYMAIIGNIILLALTIEAIARINISSDSFLVSRAIMIFGGFVTTVLMTLIIRIDLIKNNLLSSKRIELEKFEQKS
jgi:hypothetical protein